MNSLSGITAGVRRWSRKIPLSFVVRVIEIQFIFYFASYDLFLTSLLLVHSRSLDIRWCCKMIAYWPYRDRQSQPPTFPASARRSRAVFQGYLDVNITTDSFALLSSSPFAVCAFLVSKRCWVFLCTLILHNNNTLYINFLDFRPLSPQWTPHPQRC